jgi:DNA repair protein RecN (Recombination protein N)
MDERAAPFLDRIDRIASDLASLSSDLRDHAEAVELDSSELSSLEERVNLIASLRRKYGPSVAEVIARGKRSAEELEKLSDIAGLTEKARAEEKSALEALDSAAASLSAKRRKGTGKLAGEVASELAGLGFRKAGFEIALEKLPEPGPDGAETAEFLFSPNPGESPLPLRAIASSGEISRVMLALKTALAAQDRIPLLVFDEIDANVGGEIATKVAAKMAELGHGHQVLCITHLPQVAAAAAAQFLVIKDVREGRTGTSLMPVEGKERTLEIARMLGGASESALAHAEALLASQSVKMPRKES